ncbi:hypothetical protein AYO40_02520 [Planctomycetaceae bacterium SCGC AG-212-D15]|nr:hypothetical protein AYO40_02520 [Planctomycetaceae bacterium SCGC AG-212-D15]
MDRLLRRPTQRAASPQWGQLVLDPWYPLFALIERYLQNLGAEFVDSVANLKLRVAQQMLVVLAGHEPSQAERFLLERLLNLCVDGLGLLFGG